MKVISSAMNGAESLSRHNPFMSVPVALLMSILVRNFKTLFFELVELKTLYLQESLLGRILLIYHGLHLLQVPSILMQC